jgi:membrane protease YdiL (CAAX protease family)
MPSESTPVTARAVGVVWNRAERRLRLPLRLGLAVLVFVLASRLVADAVRLRTDDHGGGLLAADLGTVLRAASALAMMATVAATVAVIGVLVDRRRLRDFGFRVDRGWLADCAFGVALGLGLMAAVLVVGLLVASVVVFVSVSVAEELLVRGYLLTNLAEGLRVGPVRPAARCQPQRDHAGNGEHRARGRHAGGGLRADG